MRLALGGVFSIVVVLWAAPAWSQYEALQDAQEKIVRMNRAVLDDVENLEWDRAKKTLLDALVLGKKSGLDTHPLMARTYVHLGVVYIMGFRNRERAMSAFRRAFEIQPDIRMTPNLATTADVSVAFAEAGRQPLQLSRRATRAGGFAEPELPEHINALDCFVAEATRVDEAVPARCAVAAGLPVTKVFLLYREPAKDRFTEVEMKRTAKGWFQGRIPERVIYGRSVQYYVEARDAAGRSIVKNGQEDSPNILVVVHR